MKKLLTGRTLDLSKINIKELIGFVNSDNRAKGILKCQVMISLYNGNNMKNVCTVFGITRETVRKWKQSLRQGGIVALLSEKKAGKRAKISPEKLIELKDLIKQKPSKFGYDCKKWTGKILKNFLETNWDIKIGIRTSQLWLLQIK